MTAKQTIIRAAHGKSHPYFMMRRATAQDCNLSFEARGVMSYLLSQPDNWKINKKQLMKVGGIGRHRMDRILDELQTAGYMAYAQEQGEGGKFTEATYTLYEIPQPVAENQPPVSLSPVVDYPTADEPPADNQHLHNIDSTESENLHKNQESPNGDSVADPPDGGQPVVETESADLETKFGYTTDQAVYWLYQHQTGRRYTKSVPVTILRFTEHKVWIRAVKLDQTVEEKCIYPDKLSVEPHQLPTLSTLTPEQQVIGRLSLQLDETDGIGPDAKKHINRIIGALRDTFISGDYPLPDELIAAYGRHKLEGRTAPVEPFKVAKMVKEYRKAIGKHKPKKPLVHFPEPVHNCPICNGTGRQVGPDNSRIPCPACLEAEQANKRAKAV